MEFEEDRFQPGVWFNHSRYPGSVNSAVLRLAPYVNYQFRVIAVNEVGSSYPSLPSDRYQTNGARKSSLIWVAGYTYLKWRKLLLKKAVMEHTWTNVKKLQSEDCFTHCNSADPYLIQYIYQAVKAISNSLADIFLDYVFTHRHLSYLFITFSCSL